MHLILHNTTGRTLMYRWLIVAFSLVLFSCVSRAPVPPQTPVPASGTPASPVKPGVTQVRDRQQTWKEYDCENKKKQLPFISIVTNEMLPDSVPRGQEIRHRFVYVACTSGQSVILGKLSRKISYKGVVKFPDTTENFEIIPGTWEVNALISIPPAAEAGEYTLELTLSGPQSKQVKSTTFKVQK